MSLDRILEGACPTCGTALERRDDHGWCPECNIGHSLKMQGGEGTHTVHFGIEGGEIKTSSGTLRMGRSDARITTHIQVEEPGSYRIGATFDESHDWSDVEITGEAT